MSEYNHKNLDIVDGESLEMPGVSVFVRDLDRVFHTYSTYGRGTDLYSTAYLYLNLTPLGCQEGWGGTPDMNGEGQNWLRHHDRYR